nr:NADH dehydrogenase subunit 6 [Decimiana sp. JZ-2017]
MFNILLMLSIMSSLMFLYMNHPLSMGLILFIQAIFMCFISGMLSMSFWFSYILLLIFIGGILVLFMYITSLSPNEMFNYSNKLSLLISLSIPIYFSIKHMNFYYKMNKPENIENWINLHSYFNNFIIKIYNFPIFMITILTAIYLFLTLIAVVKIINIFKGPLRQMN